MSIVEISEATDMPEVTEVSISSSRLRSASFREAANLSKRFDAAVSYGLRRALAGQWMEDSACRGLDPDLFHPRRGESAAPARVVCARCTVTAECLGYALSTGQEEGIWGGTSDAERRSMRREIRDRKLIARSVVHGADKGYIAHLREGSEPCAACRLAHAQAEAINAEARQAGRGAARKGPERMRVVATGRTVSVNGVGASGIPIEVRLTTVGGPGVAHRQVDRVRGILAAAGHASVEVNVASSDELGVGSDAAIAAGILALSGVVDAGALRLVRLTGTLTDEGALEPVSVKASAQPHAGATRRCAADGGMTNIEDLVAWCRGRQEASPVAS